MSTRTKSQPKLNACDHPRSEAAHSALQSSWEARQLELKNSAMGRVGRDPETSIVSFDDRTANGQAHTHPMRFGGIEGLKNVLQVRWIQARARISDGNQ